MMMCNGIFTGAGLHNEIGVNVFNYATGLLNFKNITEKSFRHLLTMYAKEVVERQVSSLRNHYPDFDTKDLDCCYLLVIHGFELQEITPSKDLLSFYDYIDKHNVDNGLAEPNPVLKMIVFHDYADRTVVFAYSKEHALQLLTEEFFVKPNYTDVFECDIPTTPCIIKEV